MKQSADLQREDHHREANHDGDADGHDDGVRVVEAGDHARHVRHAQSQHRLKGKATKHISLHFNLISR